MLQLVVTDTVFIRFLFGIELFILSHFKSCKDGHPYFFENIIRNVLLRRIKNGELITKKKHTQINLKLRPAIWMRIHGPF